MVIYNFTSIPCPFFSTVIILKSKNKHKMQQSHLSGHRGDHAEIDNLVCHPMLQQALLGHDDGKEGGVVDLYLNPMSLHHKNPP